MAKKEKQPDAIPSDIYFPAEERGEVVYKEWLSEKRDGYDLVVFVNVKKEYITSVLKGENFDNYVTMKDFLMTLAKERELAKYYHNPKGPCYGAVNKYENAIPLSEQKKGFTYSADGKYEYKHVEYWTHGKRLLDEKEIKKIIHDNNFKEKAETIING